MQEQTQRQRWNDLTQLLDRVDRGGVEALSLDEVKQLCRLYRQVTIDLSRARTDQDDPDLIRYLNGLAARAHGHVYRTRPISLAPVGAFIVRGFPQAVRRHARPIQFAASVFFLTALASMVAVVHEPELAYSLYDEHVVQYENLRLEQEHGEYRGNFTFDVRESPFMAVIFIGNNAVVAAWAFALGALCCLPGVLLLAYNGRMLGTLSGLVWNHGFFWAFYSLLLPHGVLEISAICIAGGAGQMIGWALIGPGGRNRDEALRQAAGEAFSLFAGAVLLLVVAGLIEAYVSPLFPAPVRWGVAILSAVLLLGYLGFAGRRSADSPKDKS
jgi:uncharacterized membrane protein SpoIIM required for sporulation